MRLKSSHSGLQIANSEWGHLVVRSYIKGDLGGFGGSLDRSWNDPGSAADRSRVDPGSILDRSWIDSQSTLGRSWFNNNVILLKQLSHIAQTIKSSEHASMRQLCSIISKQASMRQLSSMRARLICFCCLRLYMRTLCIIDCFCSCSLSSHCCCCRIFLTRNRV